METNQELGQIVAVDEQAVIVAIKSRLPECTHCGIAHLCQPVTAAERQIKFPKKQLSFTPKIGQKVHIRFNKIVQYAFMVYLMPLFFFLTALFVAQFCFRIQHEVWLFLFALMGLVIGFFILRFVNNLFSKKSSHLQIQIWGENEC